MLAPDIVYATKQNSYSMIVTDAANLPIKELILEMEVSQSGSGNPSPSNVRSITGYTGAIVGVGANPNSLTQYSVSWNDDAGTVYEGTFDFISGKLTVTKIAFDIASADWTYNSTYSRFEKTGFLQNVKLPDHITDVADAVCTHYIASPAYAPDAMMDFSYCIDYTGMLYIADSRYTDVASFKAGLSGAKLVYAVDTPVEYDITATAISALNGTNFVTATIGQQTFKIAKLVYPTNATVTISQYLTALSNGSQTHIRITFPKQNVVLDDDDISMDGGVQITSIMNGETDLTVGTAMSNEIAITFLNSSVFDGFNWTEEFQVEFGVEINGATKWTTVGYFTGNKPERLLLRETIDFVAYDRMESVLNVMADDFIASLTYPITNGGILAAVCSATGIAHASGDEINDIMNISFSSSPFTHEGITYRDILSWIAEANGCYCKVNNEGKIQFCWFEDHTGDYTLTGDDYFAIDAGEPCVIAALKVWNDLSGDTWDDLSSFVWDNFGSNFAVWIKNTETKQNTLYPEGYEQTHGIYSIVGNPLLDGTTNQMLLYAKDIYERLTSLNGYTPMNLDAIGNWMVEAGDIIGVTVGNDTFWMPIFARTLQWNGACHDNYQCTGTMIKEPTDSEVENVVEMSKMAKKYTVRNGISIEDEGIEIRGAKYLRLKSGGVLDVESDNFVVNSNTKTFKTGWWTLDESGLECRTDASTPGYAGDYFKIRTQGQNSTGFTMETGDKNGNYGRLLWNHGTKYGYNDIIILEPVANLAGDLGSSAYYWGSIYVGTVYYSTMNQQSSRDIKHNIHPMESMGERLDTLEPVTFVYDSDPNEKKRYGLIYEDTIDRMPEICTGDEGEKAVNYVELIPMLLKEIQDLRARVKALEEREEN